MKSNDKYFSIFNNVKTHLIKNTFRHRFKLVKFQNRYHFNLIKKLKSQLFYNTIFKFNPVKLNS